MARDGGPEQIVFTESWYIIFLIEYKACYFEKALTINSVRSEYSFVILIIASSNRKHELLSFLYEERNSIHSPLVTAGSIHNLGGINRNTSSAPPLLTHRETISAEQILSLLMAFGQERNRTKREAEARYILSAMPTAALPALLWAEASARSSPTALPQGQNKLSTLQNTVSPFQSNVKCASCHWKRPGVILHAPWTFLLFVSTCIMLANVQLLSALLLSLLPMKRGASMLQGKSLMLLRLMRAATGHAGGLLCFPSYKTLGILWKWTSLQPIKHKAKGVCQHSSYLYEPLEDNVT